MTYRISNNYLLQVRDGRHPVCCNPSIVISSFQRTQENSFPSPEDRKRCGQFKWRVDTISGVKLYNLNQKNQSYKYTKHMSNGYETTNFRVKQTQKADASNEEQ
jgi:hypothetical protein